MTNLSEIIISSIPLDNEKLHAMDGALLGATYTYNYDTIGIVNNSSGFVSGFGYYNYIKLPEQLSFSPNSSLEVIIDCTTTSDINYTQCILGFYDLADQFTPIQFLIRNNYVGFLYYSNISGVRVSANKHYRFKVVFDPSDKYFKVYNDSQFNDNWEYISQIDGTSYRGGDYSISIGAQLDSGNTAPFSGSINLNRVSIKVDNEVFWQYEATSSNPYADFISYIAGLYNDNPNAEYFAPAGIDSYTKVGTLTDNNGVISGFNNDSYIQLSAFNPGSYTWEYVLKFTTGSSTSGEQALTSCLGNGDYCTPFYIQDDQVKAYMSTNGISWDSTFSGEYLTLATNTTYKLKAEFTGTQYRWYRYDNGNWIQLKSVTYSTPVAGGGTIIFGNNRGTDNPFGGSIDLNESYIKINGSLWWGMTDKKFVYDSVNDTVRLPKYGNQLYTTDNTASNVYYYMQIKE